MAKPAATAAPVFTSNSFEPAFIMPWAKAGLVSSVTTAAARVDGTSFFKLGIWSGSFERGRKNGFREREEGKKSTWSPSEARELSFNGLPRAFTRFLGAPPELINPQPARRIRVARHARRPRRPSRERARPRERGRAPRRAPRRARW